ncbi:Knot1 domain-containing protein [Forsythia ovata]|uniref:Knot1 domain-containing protein n=1 Tax=Forsythia ovata TaxID=205694 RepID=A0ABD1TAP5_9LAMI
MGRFLNLVAIAMLVVMLFMATGPIIVAEARTCETLCKNFKGWCVRAGRCEAVCKTEGFTGGYCLSKYRYIPIIVFYGKNPTELEAAKRSCLDLSSVSAGPVMALPTPDVSCISPHSQLGATARICRQEGHDEWDPSHASIHGTWNPWPHCVNTLISSPSAYFSKHIAQSTVIAAATEEES